MADTKNGKTRQGENTSVTKLKRRLGKLILTMKTMTKDKNMKLNGNIQNVTVKKIRAWARTVGRNSPNMTC